MNLEEQLKKVNSTTNTKMFTVEFDNGKVKPINVREKLLYSVSNKREFNKLADGYALLLSKYETPNVLPKEDSSLRPYADALITLDIIRVHHENDGSLWSHLKGKVFYQLAPDFLEVIKNI